MGLKRVAREAIRRLPWHLRRTTNAAITNWAARKPSFEGIYQSFSEVGGAIPQEDQASSATIRRHSLEVEGSPLHLPRLGRAQSLSHVVAILKHRHAGTFRILDFGGGGGRDYLALQAAIGNADDLSYTIVELPSVCETGRRLWADDPRVRYVANIPNETFDLCYTWSGVQYHPDVYDLMTQMAQQAKLGVLLAGSPFSDRDFVRAQVNQSCRYPSWVISLPRTKEIMNREGFDLVLAAAADQEYNVDNYPLEYQVSGSAMLLFLRQEP